MTDKKRIVTAHQRVGAVPAVFRRRLLLTAGRRECVGTTGSSTFSRLPSKPHTYWYRYCLSNFTVTTKMCLHSTKCSLRDWIYVIYSVMTAHKGVSAMRLSKKLSCQYRTAWHMLHHIHEELWARGEFVLKRMIRTSAASGRT